MQLNSYTAPSNSPLTLPDVVLVLAARARFLVAACLIGTAAALSFAMLVRPEFTSTAVIMPPERQRSAVSGLIGQLGAVSELAGSSGLPGLTNPSDLYVGILKTDSIADELIEKFGLRAQYKQRTQVDTRRALSGHTQFAVGKDTLIKISVTDIDPNRAAAVANGYVDALYEKTGHVAMTEAAQRRVFFERQLKEQRMRLAEAEGAMKTAEETTGLFHLSGQVETSLRAAAELQAELTNREVLLKRIREGATSQNPEVIRVETEIAALRSELRKLQDATAAGSPLLPAKEIPRSGLTYVRNMREVQYQQALFEALAKQYEAARIDEAKDAPVIQVVDRAQPPDRKSWPPRALFTLFGFFGSLICASVFVLVESHLRLSGGLNKLRQVPAAVVGGRGRG